MIEKCLKQVSIGKIKLTFFKSINNIFQHYQQKESTFLYNCRLRNLLFDVYVFKTRNSVWIKLKKENIIAL